MSDDQTTFTCPRGAGPATWREDGTCSYCGSITEIAFLHACESGVELGPTDKSYKVYIGERKKFYFQHLTTEGRERFIYLNNTRKLNVGYPGYFYVRPFFCVKVEPQ